MAKLSSWLPIRSESVYDIFVTNQDSVLNYFNHVSNKSNCGTGAGGFQKGNACAKRSGGGGTSTDEEDDTSSDVGGTGARYRMSKSGTIKLGRGTIHFVPDFNDVGDDLDDESSHQATARRSGKGTARPHEQTSSEGGKGLAKGEGTPVNRFTVGRGDPDEPGSPNRYVVGQDRLPGATHKTGEAITKTASRFMSALKSIGKTIKDSPITKAAVLAGRITAATIKDAAVLTGKVAKGLYKRYGHWRTLAAFGAVAGGIAAVTAITATTGGLAGTLLMGKMEVMLHGAHWGTAALGGLAFVEAKNAVAALVSLGEGGGVRGGLKEAKGILTKGIEQHNKDELRDQRAIRGEVQSSGTTRATARAVAKVNKRRAELGLPPVENAESNYEESDESMVPNPEEDKALAVDILRYLRKLASMSGEDPYAIKLSDVEDVIQEALYGTQSEEATSNYNPYANQYPGGYFTHVSVENCIATNSQKLISNSEALLTINAFCPTGKGGKIKNDCGGKGSSKGGDESSDSTFRGKSVGQDSVKSGAKPVKSPDYQFGIDPDASATTAPKSPSNYLVKSGADTKKMTSLVGSIISKIGSTAYKAGVVSTQAIKKTGQYMGQVLSNLRKDFGDRGAMATYMAGFGAMAAVSLAAGGPATVVGAIAGPTLFGLASVSIRGQLKRMFGKESKDSTTSSAKSVTKSVSNAKSTDWQPLDEDTQERDDLGIDAKTESNDYEDQEVDPTMSMDDRPLASNEEFIQRVKEFVQTIAEQAGVDPEQFDDEVIQALVERAEEGKVIGLDGKSPEDLDNMSDDGTDYEEDGEENEDSTDEDIEEDADSEEDGLESLDNVDIGDQPNSFRFKKVTNRLTPYFTHISNCGGKGGKPGPCATSFEEPTPKLDRPKSWAITSKVPSTQVKKLTEGKELLKLETWSLASKELTPIVPLHRLSGVLVVKEPPNQVIDAMGKNHWNYLGDATDSRSGEKTEYMIRELGGQRIVAQLSSSKQGTRIRTWSTATTTKNSRGWVDLETNCGGKGGKPGPCAKGSGTDSGEDDSDNPYAPMRSGLQKKVQDPNLVGKGDPEPKGANMKQLLKEKDKLTEPEKGIVNKVKDRVSKMYNRLKGRYGKTGAVATMVGIGLTVPILAPGITFVPIGIAEGVHQARKVMVGNLAANELSDLYIYNSEMNDLIDEVENEIRDIFEETGEPLPKGYIAQLREAIVDQLESAAKRRDTEADSILKG